MMASAESTIRELAERTGIPECNLRACWLRAVDAYEDPVARVAELARTAELTTATELALARDVDLLPTRAALSRPVRDALRSWA